MSLATSEFGGSKTTTNPDQSSLRLLDLQLGHTGPLLIIRQFLQAFSVKPYVPLSSACLLARPESTRSFLGRADAGLFRFFLPNLHGENLPLLCVPGQGFPSQVSSATPVPTGPRASRPTYSRRPRSGRSEAKRPPVRFVRKLQ